jgi:hypothetical protein
VNALSDKSYEHRRQWIVDRIKQLTDIFAIDTCSFAVLQNLYHVILHVDTECAAMFERYYPSFRDVMAAQDKPLPLYVQQEFADYLKCGRLGHGFLRV